MGGFIKLHRKFLEWEWYGDANVRTIFIHLLLKANYEDKKWRGIDVKRGQLIITIDKLENETGLTTSNIRTSLKHLKSTGEIAIKTTNKYTLVTILKYADYQDTQYENDKQNSKQSDGQTTGEGQTTDKQLTTTKEIKEIKESKKERNNIYTRAKPEKIKLAEYVSMTNDEHKKLIATYGQEATAKMIETLDNYKGANGKEYKNDYRAILNWVVDKVSTKDTTTFKKKDAEKKEYIKGVKTYTDEDLFPDTFE